MQIPPCSIGSAEVLDGFVILQQLLANNLKLAKAISGKHYARDLPMAEALQIPLRSIGLLDSLAHHFRAITNQ